MTRRIALLLLLVLPQLVAAQSALIPVPTHRDHVFDSQRNQLLITTSTGTIERYSLTSNTLLAPYSVPQATFYGCDITPDDRYLYVAAGPKLSTTQGAFEKFDLVTGSYTNLPYTLASGESLAWDVAITNAGHAITTTEYSGSGSVPMRRLDLATDTFSGQIRGIMQRTQLYRSADRSLVFFLEANASDGPIGTYDPATQTFPYSRDTNRSLTDYMGAVNRNGSLIAMEYGSNVMVLRPNLTAADILTGLTGGIVFDPVRDVLYAADPAQDQIVALETNFFTELYRLDIGENIGNSSTFGSGMMSVSDNGRYLFLSTPQGIRVFNVPEPATVGLLVLGWAFLRRRQSA